MNCRRILGSLTDYLHGETSVKVCDEIDRHLDGCKRCRIHVDTMKKVITLYQSWRDDTIPKDTSIRLKQVIAEEVRSRAARKAHRASKTRKRPEIELNATLTTPTILNNPTNS